MPAPSNYLQSVLRGPASALPSSPPDGVTALTTDTKTLYVSYGSAWLGVAPTGGTNGQVSVAQTGAAPLYKTISGSGATITLSSSGVLTISAIANASLSNSSITVSGGGLVTGGGTVSLGGSTTLTVTAASKSDQQTGTDTTKVVTSGEQQYHDGSQKAWIEHNGITDLTLASYNVSGVVDNGTGSWTISWSTSFALAVYAVVPGVQNSNTGQFFAIEYWLNRATSSVEIHIFDTTFSAIESAFSVMASGRQ